MLVEKYVHEIVNVEEYSVRWNMTIKCTSELCIRRELSVENALQGKKLMMSRRDYEKSHN